MTNEELNRLSYAILQSTSRLGLEKAVIEYMRDGWTVSGGVSFVYEREIYLQAMVRT